MVKYSIIVPVYNVEKYLSECLDSLVNQNYDNYEIIIVDEGSTDGSSDIVLKYKNEYPNLIKNYKKDNGGLSSARNYGIDKSSSEYLLFVDSDDYIDSNTLKVLDDNLNKYKSDILVYNMYLLNGKNITKTNTYLDIEDNIKKFITANPSACNKVFKRKLFDDNNIRFINGIYYEDLATIPTLSKYTNKIDFITEPLYYYRVTNNSIMNKKKYNKKMEDIFKVIDINYKYLNNKYHNEVEYLYIEHLLRYASLRFLDYDKYDNINKIIDIMYDKFKNWNKNKYYKKYYSFKKKVMCKLLFNKMYSLVKFLRK